MKYYVYWIHHNNHDDIFSQGYIGITKHLTKRFANHKFCAPNQHFKNALKKYPENEILWDTILIGNREYCRNIEFKLRSSENIGWNQACGGNKFPNLKSKGKPSPLKGRSRPNNVKEKISKANIGKKRSKEFCLKLSIIAKNRKPRSEESKQKLSKTLKGHNTSELTKEKISKANSKTYKIISPEGKEIIITNLKRFCEENDLNRAHIVTRKNGSKGWKAIKLTLSS
jgi:predicted GIY-YIG superfamily endonuclease